MKTELIKLLFVANKAHVIFNVSDNKTLSLMQSTQLSKQSFILISTEPIERLQQSSKIDDKANIVQPKTDPSIMYTTMQYAINLRDPPLIST